MKNKTYYGWFVLLGLCIIYAASNGIVTLSLKRFYPSLIEIFEWNRDQVTRPVSIFYFALALLMPIIGAILDRNNPKRVIFIGALIIGLGLVLFSRIQNLNHFIGVYVILAIGLAGAGLASSMYILTKWFKKKRGLAVGILLVGGSLGGALFNKVTGECIDAYGWETTAMILAGIGVLLMTIPLYIVKNNPAEMGLNVDGDTSPSEGSDGSTGISLKEALQSPTLYLIFLATGILWFCIIGMGQHQDIFLEKELKFDSKTVTNVGSAFFLFGVLGKLFFGYLSDQFNKKLVMILSIALLLVGNFILTQLSGKGGLSPYWYAATYGIAYSGVFTMIQIVVAELYYGPSYGKILGMVLTVDTLASVAGIIFLGKMSVGTSYVPAIQILMGLCAVSIVAMLLIKLDFKKKNVQHE